MLWRNNEQVLFDAVVVAAFLIAPLGAQQPGARPVVYKVSFPDPEHHCRRRSR